MAARPPERRPNATSLKVAHLIPCLNRAGTERVVANLCHLAGGSQWVVSPQNGPFRADLEADGIEVRIGARIGDLARHLADADVINAHLLAHNPALCAAIALADRPFVCTLHWRSVLPPMPGPVICTSTHVFQMQEPNRQTRHLIPNAVDTAAFDAPDRRRRTRTQIVRVCRALRCAGYFWPAVGEVLRAHADVDVIIAGDTPYQFERVVSLGDHADVPSLLRAADIFAYAPSPDQGSMDLVVLEAMASGLPCVLSDVPCVRDSIEPGVTALVSRYGDAEAFAADLLRLVADRDLRTRMGTAAAAIARERFDIRTRVPLFEAAYDQAIRDTGRRHAWREEIGVTEAWRPEITDVPVMLFNHFSSTLRGPAEWPAASMSRATRRVRPPSADRESLSRAR